MKIRKLFPAPLSILVVTHEKAIAIAERFGFRIYDALIVASVLEAGCETV